MVTQDHTVDGTEITPAPRALPINGGERWILALQSATPTELKALPKVV
jgi:hypothetical protein